MSNWYTSREAVKRAVGAKGADLDPQVDRIVEAMSRRIEAETRRHFIPKTQTRTFPWPPPPHRRGRAYVLWLDQDLLSLTTLQTQAQNASPTTIVAADYFLEPSNALPNGRVVYDRIEIDLSSAAAFESGDTPQRSISVAGSWGYGNSTRSAGTVSSGLASDAAATSMVCSDASLVNVGDTLLIQSEQLFVSDRAFAALGSILLNGALAASQAGVTVTVDPSHGIIAGEVIRVESEEMYVERVSGNDLTVRRAWNGTTLATHANDTAVHINRTLTVERGVNGTTAATHANATAISAYEPPFDVVELVTAEAIAALKQESGGWGRTVGAGESERELDGRALSDLRRRVVGSYRRLRSGAV